MADAVRLALQAAVDDGLTPGAAAAVVDLHGYAERWCVGTLAPDDVAGGAHRVKDDTVYDLASLTKLLVTTTLVADAVDDGLIELDEEPFSTWPGVQVAHLLGHDGGLVAHRPFYEALVEDPARSHLVGRRAGHDAIADAVLQTPPDAAPGARVLYSDLGFIALGVLVEVRRQQRLDALWRAHPLSAGLAARFVCLEDDGYHPALPLVAPTEHCPWRRRVVHGQVNDDNCFAMGGVAGHAGLFGSLDDVVTLAVRLLRRLRTAGDTLSAFAHHRTSTMEAPRALGFDVVSPGGSTGDALGPRTVGHLGFTGTSLWLDPDVGDGGAAWILLSNAVQLGRPTVRERSKALRVAFHRAAAP